MTGGEYFISNSIRLGTQAPDEHSHFNAIMF